MSDEKVKPTVLGLAKELKEFEGKVESKFDQIMDKLSNTTVSVSADGPNTSAPRKMEDGGPDINITTVPPGWKAMIEEILGPEFDCEYHLPNDGGQEFTIIVPKEKSNSTKEYWAEFGKDRRTKELGNTGERGVKEWALTVRQNLLRSEIKLKVYP